MLAKSTKTKPMLQEKEKKKKEKILRQLTMSWKQFPPGQPMYFCMTDMKLDYIHISDYFYFTIQTFYFFSYKFDDNLKSLC